MPGCGSPGLPRARHAIAGKERNPLNAETKRRLVRAIAEGSPEDLELLARKVVDSERRLGHGRLADELQALLNRPRSARRQRPAPVEPPGLRELPVSRRGNEVLVSVIPRDSLDHHMVLAPEVEDRFARIEREFAARERLRRFGLKPRKTILLYGPPGCGKSLGARRLAWNIGLPLMKVRFDALISSYFGESAANLRSVFEGASQRPCVLLLDECDFIARSRGDSKDIGEASRIVNQLLQLMEDYDAPGLLVATTNVERSLDSALFRRFDEVLFVPLPGQGEVERLLQTTLSAVLVAPEVDWRRVAGLLSGEASATVVKAAQDAAKAAVLSGENLVDESHLVQAIAEARVFREEGKDAQQA